MSDNSKKGTVNLSGVTKIQINYGDSYVHGPIMECVYKNYFSSENYQKNYENNICRYAQQAEQDCDL